MHALGTGVKQEIIPKQSELHPMSAMSVRVLQTILEALPSVTTATLVFNDTSSNDFSSLSRMIDSNWLPLSQMGRITVHPLMVPRSFYQQVLTDGFVDAGFCFTAIHWLKQMPTDLEYSSSEEDGNAEPSDLVTRAHADMVSFLSARHKEIRPGGSLTLSIPVQGEVDSEASMTCLDKSLEDVGSRYKDDLIFPRLPVWFRTLDEIMAGINAADGEWRIVKSSIVPIEHPAWFLTLEDKDKSIKDTPAVRDYVTVLTNMMMSVATGFIVEQMRSSLGPKYPGATKITQEVRERFFEIFMRDHARDTVGITHVEPQQRDQGKDAPRHCRLSILGYYHLQAEAQVILLALGSPRDTPICGLRRSPPFLPINITMLLHSDWIAGGSAEPV
nr:methyltransferase fus9 [Quercus suber]